MFKKIIYQLVIFKQGLYLLTQKINQRFINPLLRLVKLLFQSLTKWDKLILLFLLGVIFVCLFLIGRNNYLVKTQIIPAYGGSYREGIIANFSSEIQPVINKLTKISLVDFDQNQKIIPSLATSWEISNDQKTYTLHLLKIIKSSEVSDIIRKEKSDWSDIEIKTPDDSTIIFILQQPFSPFLANLTDPIIPLGPYKVVKEDNKGIIFQANENFYQGHPFLSEIQLKFYPNETSLAKAIKSHKIDGVGSNFSNSKIPSFWNLYSMNLPRYLLLFFNLKREILQDQNIRTKLANGEKLDKEINLTLVTSDSASNLTKATEIQQKWQLLGAKIEIVIKNNKDLQKEVLPTRNFDLLIYGLDYGADPDPYPFWHSSQISDTGLNLANFSDVDADKLLEEARQTSNSEERAKKYQAFQKILDTQKPAIVLEQIKWQFAITNKIMGIIDHQGISGADRFFEVWKWYSKTRRVQK